MEKSNRVIDALILGGEWEIEKTFAVNSLSNYLHELSLLENGATLSDLNYSQRREKTFASIISPSGAVIRESIQKANENGSIALLKLSGVMRSDDGLSSRGVDSLISEVQDANANSAIKGIIIEAQTGGGEAMAGAKLMSAIRDSKKPVIVFAHLLASAGIKGTLYANEIIASSEFAEFGSIGTYVSIDKEILNYIKENYIEIYSEKSPDKNKQFRDLLNGEQSTILQEITKHDEMFMAAVAKARPLKGDIEKTLAGGMFSAREAKRRGLIDGIGGMDLAIQRINYYIKNKGI